MQEAIHPDKNHLSIKEKSSVRWKFYLKKIILRTTEMKN